MTEIGVWNRVFTWQPVIVESGKTKWFSFVERRLMNYAEYYLEKGPLEKIPTWATTDTMTWWEYR